MSKDKKIGEILLEKRLISKAALDNALEKQRLDKSQIGKILISENVIRPLAFHKAVAEKFSLEFVNLEENEPDWSLFKVDKKNQYLALEILPFKEEVDSITLVTSNISEALHEWAIAEYPYKNIKFMITSPLDILWSLQKSFEHEDNENARFNLFKKAPELSAQKLFSKINAPSSFLLLATIIAVFFIFPQTSFVFFAIFLNTLFFTSISFKTLAFIGSNQRLKLAQRKITNFPIYTILVPLYKEKDTIASLINAINAFDYPKSKLDVKLVVEADDKETIQALKNLNPPAYFEIIRTPFSLPRTKPKACNYALQYARGEFVTIYDAEDIPNRYQLKAVLNKFAHGDKNLACVQARLNYYNYDDNQLTRWFALEYATWFDFVMNGLETMKLAIPLGGTSNHIKTKILNEVGGWDAFNVTEDADLGMRLKRYGYDTGTVDSITLEEAPNNIHAWLLQRKRWIKGFMQTYIVHMRSPLRFIREAGLKSFLILQFFIGFPPIIYLLSPILLFLGFAAETFAKNIFIIPTWLIAIATFNFLYGTLVHIAFSIIANFRSSDNGKRMFKPLIFSALTFPFYSFLHIFASFSSLRELILKPHYWEKTQHGLAKTNTDHI